MSRKLLAFCLRLVCIEFVYILFSHSPFEQVCKRFPDAETVTFCDIRRRERRKLFMFCSYFVHKLHLLHACKQPQGSHTMHSARAGYIIRHTPLSPPSPPARHRALVYPSVVPICASCVILERLDGYREAFLMQYCRTSHVRTAGPTIPAVQDSAAPFAPASPARKREYPPAS